MERWLYPLRHTIVAASLCWCHGCLMKTQLLSVSSDIVADAHFWTLASKSAEIFLKMMGHKLWNEEKNVLYLNSKFVEGFKKHLIRRPYLICIFIYLYNMVEKSVRTLGAIWNVIVVIQFNLCGITLCVLRSFLGHRRLHIHHLWNISERRRWVHLHILKHTWTLTTYSLLIVKVGKTATLLFLLVEENIDLGLTLNVHTSRSFWRTTNIFCTPLEQYVGHGQFDSFSESFFLSLKRWVATALQSIQDVLGFDSSQLSVLIAMP